MKYETPVNPNYVATIVQINATHTLEGLDNLVGFNAFGLQALVSKDTAVGTVGVLFTAETQLSEEFARVNNLHRHSDRNIDESKTGYLEDNRRVRAIKLRGHQSNALFLALDEVVFPGSKPGKTWKVDTFANSGFAVGDVFDKLDGVDICKKYVIKEPGVFKGPQNKVRRVDLKLFPQHTDSENYWRNEHKIPDEAKVIISQKLHGTSGRWAVIPVPRDLTLREKIARKFGVKVDENKMSLVSGSRRVVKSIDGEVEGVKDHFYDEDLWSHWGEKIKDAIPDGFIVFGEIIGWTPDGKAIQQGYTYNLNQPIKITEGGIHSGGGSELYVYRVAVVTGQGRVVDLTWEQVKVFCEEAGLKHVPELFTAPKLDFIPEGWIDKRLADYGREVPISFVDPLVQLSDPKSVDEGVCVRYEGPSGPYILKYKSPIFLEAETKLLDQGIVDTESEESA